VPPPGHPRIAPVSAVLAAVLAVVLTAGLAAAPPGLVLAQEAPAEEAGEESVGLAYETEFSDLEDEGLADALAAAANSVQLAGQPPDSVAGLARRARGDLDRLLGTMHALGYWGGTVNATIAGRPLDARDLASAVAAAEGPPVVRFEVAPGPLYEILVLDIVDARDGSFDLPVAIDRSALGLAEGDPARSDAIAGIEGRLVAQMQRAGHPFAGVPVRQVMVDHARDGVEVAFAVEPGPVATLGAVSVDGLDRVDERFVRRRVPFEPGAAYDPATIEDLRADLASLEVFSSVRVSTADTLDDEGRLPITVDLTERPPRFVGFGAEYRTDEGFGTRVYWGHRNLFGGAERLRLDFTLGGIGEDLSNAGGFTEPSTFDLEFEAAFRKPDFLAVDQDLTADLRVTDETTDAFDRRGARLATGLERRLTDTLAVDGGVSFELSEIVEKGESDVFKLIGFPVGLRFDTSDDLLDPTRGVRVRLRTTPYPGGLASSLTFVRTRLDATAYYDFGTEGDTVVATRTALGSVVGAATDDLPADQRFYAGGGGSIRGYAFQSVGPEDADGDPIGGASLIEGSLELRQKVTDTIGLVGFVDGGGVFDTEVPDFGENLRFGAGFGLRYYTGFGPIRADLAFPLNSDGGDAAFQFYASFGQAF